VGGDGQEREDREGGEGGKHGEDFGAKVEGVPELAGSDVDEYITGVMKSVVDIAVVVLEPGIGCVWHLIAVCSIALSATTRDAWRTDHGECCPGAERGTCPVGVGERGRCVLQNAAHALRIEGFVVPGAAALAVGGSPWWGAREFERVQFRQRGPRVDGGSGRDERGGRGDERERRRHEGEGEHEHEGGLDGEALGALPVVGRPLHAGWLRA
jgi:hypothetical protein